MSRLRGGAAAAGSYPPEQHSQRARRCAQAHAGASQCLVGPNMRLGARQACGAGRHSLELELGHHRLFDGQALQTGRQREGSCRRGSSSGQQVQRSSGGQVAAAEGGPRQQQQRRAARRWQWGCECEWQGTGVPWGRS
jgi:hypothetical protein